MHADVITLRDFYDSPLGAVTRRILSQHIRARWPRLPGATLVGLGYAAPYLGSFRGETERIAALMPATQGAILWPSSAEVASVLYEDEMLPLGDESVDNLLLVHCLEASDNVRKLLREIWRVLKGEGRVIIVAPNRRGVWARLDHTPFGHGQPFNRSQLERHLTDALLTPIEWSGGLYMPPARSGLLLRGAMTIEPIGARIWPLFAGVIIVEARKEIEAPMGWAGARRLVPKLVPAGGSGG